MEQFVRLGEFVMLGLLVRSGPRRSNEDEVNRLRSDGAAFQELGVPAEHVQGKRKNNLVESAHAPSRRRERRMQRTRVNLGHLVLLIP